MLGGVFLDKNGWNFWVATVESGGRVAVQAGLATVLSPRYVLPEDRDVVECVNMALDSIRLSLETNVSAEDRRACEPYPPAPCSDHFLYLALCIGSG